TDEGAADSQRAPSPAPITTPRDTPGITLPSTGRAGRGGAAGASSGWISLSLQELAALAPPPLTPPRKGEGDEAGAWAKSVPQSTTAFSLPLRGRDQGWGGAANTLLRPLLPFSPRGRRWIGPKGPRRMRGR